MPSTSRAIESAWIVQHTLRILNIPCKKITPLEPTLAPHCTTNISSGLNLHHTKVELKFRMGEIHRSCFRTACNPSIMFKTQRDTMALVCTCGKLVPPKGMVEQLLLTSSRPPMSIYFHRAMLSSRLTSRRQEPGRHWRKRFAPIEDGHRRRPVEMTCPDAAINDDGPTTIDIRTLDLRTWIGPMENQKHLITNNSPSGFDFATHFFLRVSSKTQHPAT